MGKVFNIAALQQEMVRELPGTTVLVRTKALWNAAEKFCRESEAWREELPAIDIVTGQVDYNLVAEWDANIQRLEWVKLNNAAGVAAGIKPDPLDPRYWTMTPADPEYVTLHSDLTPTADITGALTVKAILVPSRNSYDVADWFVNRYCSGIVAHAIGSLMREPNKRYTNVARAVDYEAEYRDQLLEAKGELRRKYNDEPISMGA